MKRSLIYILVVLVVAAWVGTLIAKDPGYVLVSWDGMTLETGLWVMLAFLVIAAVFIYYLLRFGGALMRGGARWQGWRAERRRGLAEARTIKGMMQLQAGEYERAEKLLLGGTRSDQSNVLNYILAAKAADGHGDTARRDGLLSRAEEADPAAKQAVAVARAEMAAKRNQWRLCLDALEGCDNNRIVVELKKKALFAVKDWEKLIKLLPDIRKFADDPTEVYEFERQVALKRLADNVTDDAHKIVFKKLQDRLKKDPDIILAFCKNLQDEQEAEQRLRKALKGTWDARLVKAYGSLGTDTLNRRMKQARAWQKQHADDHALQFCLGELFRLQGDHGQAKACYEKSIDLKPTTEASERLGELLSFDGDYTRSAQFYRRALSLSTSKT